MSILALAWSSIVTNSLLSGDLVYIVLTYKSLNARGKPCLVFIQGLRLVLTRRFVGKRKAITSTMCDLANVHICRSLLVLLEAAALPAALTLELHPFRVEVKDKLWERWWP